MAYVISKCVTENLLKRCICNRLIYSLITMLKVWELYFLFFNIQDVYHGEMQGKLCAKSMEYFFFFFCTMAQTEMV